MTRTDIGQTPDFMALSDENFFNAHTEFMRLAPKGHPHWKLWLDESTRRHREHEALRRERSPYFTAAYLAQATP